jgi:predicted DNA-binding transcriptional regulator AlpA
MQRGRKKQNLSTGLDSVVLPGPAPDALLDVLGAAQWFGVSRAKLFELMRDEEDFPVIRISERMIRFDRNSLYVWSLRRQARIA